MPNLPLLTAETAIIAACLVAGLNGSSIHFQSSASYVKPLDSQNFTLRCSLSDTSPAPGSPGAVVGKRSVATPRRGLTERQVLEDHRNNKDTVRTVTTTAENVMLITSIIISKDGTDIASIIEHFSAKPMGGGAINYHVTGQLTPSATEKGYLEVTWPYPSAQDTGIFTCDVDTLSASGHSYDFSKSLTVTESEVTLADLVTHLSGQQKTIDALTKSNDALRDRIIQLESERVPDVFFSSALTTGPNPITTGQVFVFNYVLVNQGSAYNNSTGTFSAPVTGYYHFTMTAVAASHKYVYMDLQKNGNNVMRAWGHGTSDNYHSATNNVFVKLVKGDKVQVVSGYISTIYRIDSTLKENIFSGKLIALE